MEEAKTANVGADGEHTAATFAPGAEPANKDADDPMYESRKKADEVNHADVLAIETEQRTKFEINDFLVSEFGRVNDNPLNNIRDRTWVERLIHSMPADFDLDA